MKFNLLSLGLLSFSMLTLAPSLTSSASATCVTTDVSNQVSIHGSKEPSQQTNNVEMQTEDECLGNTTTSTSTQVHTGSNNAQQTRDSNHSVGSKDDETGVSGPTIEVPVETKTDVYSPAHNPRNHSENIVNSTEYGWVGTIWGLAKVVVLHSFKSLLRKINTWSAWKYSFSTWTNFLFYRVIGVLVHEHQIVGQVLFFFLKTQIY